MLKSLLFATSVLALLTGGAFAQGMNPTTNQMPGTPTSPVQPPADTTTGAAPNGITGSAPSNVGAPTNLRMGTGAGIGTGYPPGNAPGTRNGSAGTTGNSMETTGAAPGAASGPGTTGGGGR